MSFPLWVVYEGAKGLKERPADFPRLVGSYGRFVLPLPMDDPTEGRTRGRKERRRLSHSRSYVASFLPRRSVFCVGSDGDFSPNSGYTEGVLPVRVKAGCSLEVLALGRRFRLRRNAVLRFYVDFDCAGSHKRCGPRIAISKASFYRVFAYVFGHERQFAWQVQGIHRLWRSET